MTTDTPFTPTLDQARNLYAIGRDEADGQIHALTSFDEFDRLLTKVRADAVRNVATAFIDWDVVHGHSRETKSAKRGFKTAAWLEAEADRMEGKA